MTMYIGGVLGGPESRQSEFFKILTSSSRAMKSAGEIGSASIDLVFLMPGSLTAPNFEGLRTGKFSRAKKTLMIQVAVPDRLVHDEQPLAFIVGAMREAVILAKTVFKKAKIDFDEPAYNRAINIVETQLRNAEE